MKRILSTTIMLLLIGSVVFAGAAAEKPSATKDTNQNLKALIGYVDFDASKEYPATTAEAITGYHVQYDSLPSTDETSKLSAILASKEDYDVMNIEYGWFASTVGLGAYLPLDDLLAKYGKEIYEGTDKSLWTNTTIDGKIMGIPYRLSNENYTAGRRVRTDLMKKAGITQMPSTPDELHAFLKTVKDKLGIIPMTGNGAIVDEIASAYGIFNPWNVTSEGIRNRVSTPGAREYVEFMHKLYVEGLIDSEWAQNTTAAAQEKFLSGRALVYPVFWWNEPSATDTLLKNFPDATFSYLPPLKNAKGESGMPINRGTDNVAVIPVVSKNPEGAMKWMNAKVATPETFRKLTIGEEDVHYKVIGENEYEPIQPAFTNDMNHANVYLTGTITKDYGAYWAQTRVRKNETLYNEFLKMQENVENATIYYDPTTFMTPNSEFTKLAPSVNTYVNDTILQMIVGTRDVNEWDDFVAEYYAMGGDQLEKILNDWWDANKAVVEPMIKR